jgi:hypothetical protein
MDCRRCPVDELGQLSHDELTELIVLGVKTTREPATSSE